MLDHLEMHNINLEKMAQKYTTSGNNELFKHNVPEENVTRE